MIKSEKIDTLLWKQIDTIQHLCMNPKTLKHLSLALARRKSLCASLERVKVMLSFRKRGFCQAIARLEDLS
jgi:hypothetical protein